VVCDKGYILETPRFFGEGKLWLPQEQIKIERVIFKRFWPKSVDITCGGNQIRLKGKLVDAFV